MIFRTLCPLSNGKWRHLAFEGEFQIHQFRVPSGFYSPASACPATVAPLLQRGFLSPCGNILISIRTYLFFTHLKKQVRAKMQRRMHFARNVSTGDSEAKKKKKSKWKRNFLNPRSLPALATSLFLVWWKFPKCLCMRSPLLAAILTPPLLQNCSCQSQQRKPAPARSTETSALTDLWLLLHPLCPQPQQTLIPPSFFLFCLFRVTSEAYGCNPG